MTTFEGTPGKTISSSLKDRERERRERRMQGKNGMCIRCNAVTDFQGRPERAALKDVRTGALKDANGEEQECATGRRKKRSEKCVTPVCQALRKFVRGNLLKTSCGKFLSLDV